MDNRILTALTDKSSIRVIWDVLPIDYTREKEKNIKQKVSDKYGIPLKNVKVDPKFLMVGKDGKTVPLTNDTIMNIKDPKFQQTMFKEYLEITEKKDYDWEYILSIDAQINASINYDVYDKFKKYSLKWIRWSNFLSYGPDNYFDFTKLHGLVLVNGEPSNQSGKTTFSIELLRFLLFGKTSKYKTLEPNFNNNLPEATELKVEGEIEIEGERYIIRRTVTRPSLKRRRENSKVNQKVEYYKILADGEEELLVDEEETENQAGENASKTNRIIKEAIGNETDFDLIICATNDNLTDLITFKETDRGRLLSKWIGLLPLETKDKIARDIYNKQIASKFLSNVYNRETLASEIVQLKESIENDKKEVENKDAALKSLNEELEGYNKEKERLLESRKPIDNSVMSLDIQTHNNKIESIKTEGVRYKAKKEANEQKLSTIPVEDYKEDDYINVLNEKNRLIYEMTSFKDKINQLKKEQKQLRESEYCPTCHRKFDNIDNTPLIEEREQQIKELIEKGVENKRKVDVLENTLSLLEQKKRNFNERSNILIENQSLDLKMDNLRERLINLYAQLKVYNQNKESIDYNTKLQIDINNLKARITEVERAIKDNNDQKGYFVRNIVANEQAVKQREEYIQRMGEEEKIRYNWSLYLEMVGKNGISKMVLRNTLPIINAELKRLLTDICNFDVEILITEKNDVIFTYCKEGCPAANISGASGLEKTISSLALRTVLANISTMPKLNFIVLDELWGCVADDNLSKIKPFIEKIASSYDFVLQVSHNPLVADWHDRIITVANKNNVSYIK